MPHAPTPTPKPIDANAARILIVDDDRLFAGALADLLNREGHAATIADTAGKALELLANAGKDAAEFDLALLDAHLPDSDGLALLDTVAKRHKSTAAIVMTGYGSVESAVAALRSGASDFLVKPLVEDELRQSLARALRQRALLAENSTLRHRIAADEALRNVVGSDPRMIRVLGTVRAVAAARTTVLMTGESGTGKSLFAHAIHDLSPRRSGPFVELSCGSIPETLLESELFGHVKGAFTGAHADKPGRFLAADGGTLFLDEINSASPAMQLKLLRVLQERKFEPVGSNRTVEVDARVLLATNQPLEHLVNIGHFRQDLYYRINVVQIELPPLRDRRADIPALASHFLEKQSRELGRTIVGFSPQAMDALQHYKFPGNIRELANIVERAAVLAQGQTISAEDLPEHVTAPQPRPAAKQDAPWTPMTLEAALRDPERRILVRALEANNWNRQSTAEQLGINRTTLYKKMKSLGIDGPEQ